MTLKCNVSPKLTLLLRKAAEFHGHLGPFLAIGVRMGLIGLKKIGRPKNNKLIITASLPLRVPFSCVIDGLQISTKCTVGNRKLSLKDLSIIQAIFKREDNVREIMVTLSRPMFEEMKSRLLQEAVSADEVRRLAWIVASTPEDELFEITS